MNFSAIEAGYIYILQNPAFSADTLKAGKTARCVYTRARELSRETGVPEPFAVAYSGRVWDIAQAEDILFRRLKRFRPRNRKEYFRLPLASAIAVAEEVIAEVNSQQRETLAQRLQTWREFEHEMRERDEASRAWHQVQEDYPEQFAWMHAPDPADEQA